MHLEGSIEVAGIRVSWTVIFDGPAPNRSITTWLIERGATDLTLVSGDAAAGEMNSLVNNDVEL